MNERPTRAAGADASSSGSHAEPARASAASGYIALLLGVGVAHYGMARRELLQAAALSEDELGDPGALVPEQALWDLMRFVRQKSGDAALGLRLADAIDLRAQGFWGYALLSSTSMRERLGVHLRYQAVRSSIPVAMRVENGLAIVDFDVSHLDQDLRALVCDWGAATACFQHQRHMGPAPCAFELWLDYPEQPHHRELRSRVRGVIVFDAPFNRLSFPASDLDRQLPGDPHLAKLAVGQLETQLASQRSEATASTGSALIDLVRARLIVRLANDASLERIAKDVRVSARTLRRRLGALGTSFQELLDDVRRSRAVAYLAESELAVEQISAQLGYGDPANFRRAFRRWEGLAPSAFRAQKRALAPTPGAASGPLASAPTTASKGDLAGDDRAWPPRPLPLEAE